MTTTPATGRRIESIDALRGLVMVLMALDHVRDYFHLGSMQNNPTDLETTTPALFFTRWITHFCAPVFVMLAGSAAFLYGHKGGRKQLSLFLLTRGLWLMLLEVTVVRLGWTFNAGFSSPFMLQVIWAIGCSMVVLSLLVQLPWKAVGLIGITIVCLHNLLDYIPQDGNEGPITYVLWAVWHRPSPIALGPAGIFTLYPLLPWMGIMCCGYALGSLYITGYKPKARRRLLITWGLLAIGGFVLLRWTNLYGNPEPWVVQKSPLYTLLSFLNTEKYPPSLQFTLMTLGPALLLLAAMEHARGRVNRFLVAIGRVPLFYYILHLYMAHGIAVLAFLVLGHSINDIDYSLNSFSGMPDTFGFSLAVVYGVWTGIVLILYPLCIWYGNLKKRSKWKGWSYL